MWETEPRKKKYFLCEWIFFFFLSFALGECGSQASESPSTWHEIWSKGMNWFCMIHLSLFCFNVECFWSRPNGIFDLWWCSLDKMAAVLTPTTSTGLNVLNVEGEAEHTEPAVSLTDGSLYVRTMWVRDQCHTATAALLINLLLHDEKSEGKDESSVWWICFQSTDNIKRQETEKHAAEYLLLVLLIRIQFQLL